MPFSGSQSADDPHAPTFPFEDFADTPAPDESAQSDGRQRFILTIDDSSTVRAVIEYSFARAGFISATFPDGITALQALTEGRVPIPDLVLLDIGLPRLDGYEVATILRANPAFAFTPIVMLSAHDGFVDRMRSRMVGARGFIAKPFKTGELIAAICDYLGIAPPDPQTGFDANS
jgi:twitching motility two-component system response regulator PilG